MTRNDPLRRSGFGTTALPVEAAVELDGVCDAFESAWRAGDQPRIADAVAELVGDVKAAC